MQSGRRPNTDNRAQQPSQRHKDTTFAAQPTPPPILNSHDTTSSFTMAMTPPPIEATPLQTTTTTTTNTTKPNTTYKNNNKNNKNNNNEKQVIIHSIVTSASSLLGNNDTLFGDTEEDDSGDIVASIVVLLQSPPKNSAASCCCNKMVLMVQRMDGTTVASFDLPSSSTMTSTITSSFLSASNHCDDDDDDNDSFHSGFIDGDVAERSHDGSGDLTLNKFGTGRVGGRGGYKDALLCWASFREDCGGQSNSNARKMLCVLGNPKTLLVYDVLGDVHMNLFPSNNDNTDCATTTTTFSSSGFGDNKKNKKVSTPDIRGDGGSDGGGPGGYTILLPFRARSIFPNGDDAGGGILIVRAPSREDYAIVDQGFNNAVGPVQCHSSVELQEGEIMDYDDNDKDDGDCDMNDANGGAVTRVGQRYDGTDNENDSRNQNNDANGEEENHPSLEDPPVPLRYLEKGESMFVDSIGAGGAATETAVDGESGEFQDGIEYDDCDGVPCLFSLRHPLDEIHPLAVVVEGSAMTNQQHHEEGRVNNDNLVLFTNVLETLVFIGSPRLFHGTIPYHAATTASPICVTYNEQKNRHTFWSLSDAVFPMEALPLWKTTGQGAWQSSTSVKPSPGGGASEMDKNEHDIFASEYDDDNSSERIGSRMDDENDKDIDPVDHLRQLMHKQEEEKTLERGAPSCFSDIHPEFALKKIFVDDFIIPSTLGVGSGIRVDHDADVDEAVTTTRRRQIFLATDSDARGDLVLCVFTPNLQEGRGERTPHSKSAERSKKDRDSDSCVESSAAMLTCYSLHLHESSSAANHRRKTTISIQSVSHIVDLLCSSAQPVRSVPIPLAPFTWRDNRVSGMSHGISRKCTSRYHNQDRDTFATDVLIVPHGWQVGKLRSMFRLYRAGTIHIADFTLPKTTLDAISVSYSVSAPPTIRLKNAVGNRVDIYFTHADKTKKMRYSPPTAVVRALFSLVMYTSPVTETALRAIESSLVYSQLVQTASQPSLQSSRARELSDNNEKFLASTWGISLSLLIRSDVVRLFQQRSSIDRSNSIPRNDEDAGWYSLTVVLLNLFGMKRTSDEEQAGARRYQTGKKASKKQSSASWEALLQSEYHSLFCAGEGTVLFGAMDGDWAVSSRTSDQSISESEFSMEPLSVLEYVTKLELDATTRGISHSCSFRHLIFDSLHLLHEDSRLVSRSRGSAWTLRLGTFLVYVAKQMNPMMLDYEDHYHRLLGTSRCQSNSCTSYFIPNKEKRRLSTFSISPCIMTSLDSIIQLDAVDCSLEDAAYWVSGYYALLQSAFNGACAYTWIVLRLFIIRFDRKNILSEFNSFEATELNQYHRERAVILAMLDEGIYHPFQLQDELPMGVVLPLLEAVVSCRLNPPDVDSTGELWPAAAYDLVGRDDLAEFLTQPNSVSSQGTHLVDDSSPSDDPDNDGLLGLDDFASLIFPDNRIREAARLLRSSRPLFLNVPRPVELSDHDYERSKQEKLLLLCRRSISLSLGRGMLTLGTHKAPAAEQLLIPNIVLAGRVPPMNGILALDMSACPSNFRVWPEFHNGVAAGLRLPQATKDKLARTVTRTWIKFNKPMHASDNTSPSYSHGGFLMALGLRGYLSALTTTDLTDYLTQGIITTTVGIFLGLASNQRGSCDPSVSKMLCLHVPSLLPPSFLPMDLASPVQASAVAAIGLLYLGSSHRLMTEFLLNEIGRPPAKDQNAIDREGFALVCGLALGMVNLSRGESTVRGLEDLQIEDRLQRYISGVTDGNESHGRKSYFGVGNQGEMDRNSRIFESNALNRDITAPGATLAIGLMYIRSHNVSVAASLQLPDTHFLLDYIRPDMLGLRVISRSLILWHDIDPTSDWIDAQIPIIVKQSISLMKDTAVNVMKMNIADETHDKVETHRGNSTKKITDFDTHAIRQANAYIIAGACFALGLKYAGSANRFAATAIIERTLWFLELRDNKVVVTLTQRPDNSTLITCLCTTAISLAMVMAGTGDLDSFRLFRSLRWKCDDNTLYGAHMIFGAAIGLLFLGGGKCTLGSNPEDVAMLIASFYPHLPVSSSDNQYHLQALRHLYVLASHKRILEACDVDSNEKVCIPIELRVSNSDANTLSSTPFLVANGTSFTQLSLKSERYNPIYINMSDWNDRGDLPTLFVKRKSGHLSYLQDANGLLSLSLQQGGSTDSLMKSVKLFSDAAILTTFAKYFCVSSFDNNRSFESFCSDIAYECMKEGKTDDALVMILGVFRLIDSFCPRKRFNIENIWDAKLITTFSTISTSSLINREQLSLLRELADDTFRDGLLSLVEVRGEQWWERYDRHFGAVLVWTGVPLMSPC